MHDVDELQRLKYGQSWTYCISSFIRPRQAAVWAWAVRRGASRYLSIGSWSGDDDQPDEQKPTSSSPTTTNSRSTINLIISDTAITSPTVLEKGVEVSTNGTVEEGGGFVKVLEETTVSDFTRWTTRRWMKWHMVDFLSCRRTCIGHANISYWIIANN